MTGHLLTGHLFRLAGIVACLIALTGCPRTHVRDDPHPEQTFEMDPEYISVGPPQPELFDVYEVTFPDRVEMDDATRIFAQGAVDSVQTPSEEPIQYLTGLEVFEVFSESDGDIEETIALGQEASQYFVGLYSAVDPTWTVCALYLHGRLYEVMASKVATADPPTFQSAEEETTYRHEISYYAGGMLNEAMQSWIAAVERADHYYLENACSDGAWQSRTHYRQYLELLSDTWGAGM